ncbi:FUSC family protein [Marinitenerispora sediminis]|uniref:FUSC family protein n=1 Tax=Marinitenerispora sediminis TaxID=1931232 RepID=A0A368T8M7_9ACTN|nr:aromatic acid exporter family protein [Marinitenerispora sediminis]RCV53530.1 hypothetical protein DEF28_10380 [Marinitenerispora sediminis]RCV57686.1 hypothetical protein DEF23_10265 [Marinitenerispora sediminis]RCV60757.1 hypothetical protein DEF24_06180 [Marinitenerispora sediminis]
MRRDAVPLVLILKSALAACLAWVVADEVLGATSPAFAPFSAVLMMQVTVYQSVWQALRYLLAVTLGVLVQAVLGFLLGAHLWTFALVALAALGVSRWRALGAQGAQVATAAFFAYSSFVSAAASDARLVELGEILLLVVVGSAFGVAVNLLLLPPLRLRDARYGTRVLADGISELAGDMAAVLREGPVDAERTDAWRYRARQLEETVPQARAAVDRAWESIHYNPRRLLWRRSGPALPGHRGVVEALGRASEQLLSITRDLRPGAGGDRLGPEFRTGYGDFLAAAAEAARQLGTSDGGAAGPHPPLESVEEHCDRLRAAADTTPPAAPGDFPAHAVLLVDADRLLEELRHARDALPAAGDG